MVPSAPWVPQPQRAVARRLHRARSKTSCRISNKQPGVTVMKKMIASIVAVLAISSTAFAAGNYKVDVKAPASAKKGEKATTTIHVEGTGKYHLNMEYPTKLSITAPTGVKIEKDKQTKADAKKFAEGGADFDVVFTSSETGKKSFTGELKFAWCASTDCNPATEKIAFDVEVK
jgi:hypothetical protein